MFAFKYSLWTEKFPAKYQGTLIEGDKYGLPCTNYFRFTAFHTEATFFFYTKQHIVITILYHKVAAKCQSLFHVKEKMVPWSCRHLYAVQGHENSCFSWAGMKVIITCCSFLWCILWNVTSLSLSRISSFKRSWELLTGVSTCLYDLWITWSLKYNIWRSSQTEFSLHYLNKEVNRTEPSPSVSVPCKNVTDLVFLRRATSFLNAWICSGLGFLTFRVLTATGPCQ